MDISKIEIKDVNFSYKDVKVYRKNLNMYLEKGSGMTVMKQMKLKKICICLMMMTMTLMTLRILMIEWLRILMCMSNLHVKQLFVTLLVLYE